MLLNLCCGYGSKHVVRISGHSCRMDSGSVKIVRNQAKRVQNGYNMRPKWAKIEPKGNKKEATLFLNVIENSILEKGALGRSRLGGLVHFLVPSWAASGSQNPAFGHQVVPKSNKNDVQGRVSEKGWNFDWNLFGKCRFLNVLNPPKCFIYKHFGGFRWLW